MSEKLARDRVLRAYRNQVLEYAAKIAEKAYGGKAHTYASENADLYRAQDDACKRIAKLIRAAKTPVMRERA